MSDSRSAFSDDGDKDSVSQVTVEALPVAKLSESRSACSDDGDKDSVSQPTVEASPAAKLRNSRPAYSDDEDNDPLFQAAIAASLEGQEALEASPAAKLSESRSACLDDEDNDPAFRAAMEASIQDKRSGAKFDLQEKTVRKLIDTNKDLRRQKDEQRNDEAEAELCPFKSARLAPTTQFRIDSPLSTLLAVVSLQAAMTSVHILDSPLCTLPAVVSLLAAMPSVDVLAMCNPLWSFCSSSSTSNDTGWLRPRLRPEMPNKKCGRTRGQSVDARRFHCIRGGGAHGGDTFLLY